MSSSIATAKNQVVVDVGIGRDELAIDALTRDLSACAGPNDKERCAALMCGAN